MTRWRKTGAIALLLALGGMAPAAPEPAGPAEPIYNVRADDEAMNAAIRQGVASLPEFYRHLARPGSDERDFMIKFDILPGEDAEFVWAVDLDRSTSPMTGTLANQPEKTNHRIGQRVPIPEADIIDWMYRKGRAMQGGFTNRVLLGQMPADEAASFREFLGW